MKFEDLIKKKEAQIKAILEKNPRASWAQMVEAIDGPEYENGTRVLFYMSEENHVANKERPRIGVIKAWAGRGPHHREVYEVELEDGTIIKHSIYIVEVLNEKTTD